MELEELREYFAGRLPHRLGEIQESYRACLENGWTGESPRTFHRLAHSLAGAGATFGFPEVSEIARSLEILLKEHLNGGAPPGPIKLQAIEDLLARLRA